MFFSIGIPAYKSTYLKECINSVLGQTYSNFELIIVNDASPYKVDEVVNSFSDPRIRYFENEVNSGAENIIDNWNRCLSKSTGEFFILLGDDDMLAPNYLSSIFEAAIKWPDVNIYHCRSIIIDKDGKAIGITPTLPAFETVLESIWHRINGFRSHFISDFIFRRTELEKNGGFFKLPLAWGSDDISQYIATGKNGIRYLSEPLLYYRRSAITISSSGNIDLKIQAISQVCEWLQNYVRIFDADNEVQIFIKNEILNGLNKYYKKTIISILAYHSSSRNIITLCYYLFNRRSKFKINVSEIFYIILLNLKKNYIR